jgi:hypothetical protein
VSNGKKINSNNKKVNNELWHRRMGHRSIKMLKSLPNAADGILMSADETDELCETCALTKATRESVPRHTETRAAEPLQLVHSDIWGPTQTPSIHGHRYAVSFANDFFAFCESVHHALQG